MPLTGVINYVFAFIFCNYESNFALHNFFVSTSNVSVMNVRCPWLGV